MTDILEAIRVELWRAHAARRHRRARRRLVVVISTSLLLLAAAGTMAAVTDFDPLAGEDLPAPVAPAQNAPTTRATVSVDSGSGNTATNVLYRSAENGLCEIVRRPGDPANGPTVGCASGFVIGDNFLRDGPANLSVMRDTVGEPARILVYGYLRDGASNPTATIGGDTKSVVVGQSSIAIPIDRSPGGLTEEGKEVAAHLPDHLILRPFIAIFDRVPLPAKVSLTITDAEGKRWTVERQAVATPNG